MKLLTTLLLIASILLADDAATLKQRVQTRAQAIVDLLNAGAVTEGSDGLLKPITQLEPAQSQTMRDENQDREAIFRLIAEKSHLTLEEVQAAYSKRARAKFPPAAANPAVIGACKLVPAKSPDVSRLLQYLKQGMNYASQKKFDLALAEFQPAVAIDKNFLALNQNVGAAQMGLKKYPDAEASFKAEIKLVECLAGLTDSQLASFGYFFEVPEKDPAQRRKAQAARLKTELPKAKATANFNLACAYSQQKQKEPAIAALKAALDGGLISKQTLTAEPDLTFVRQAPEFRDLLAQAK